mgnify:CR=1 FL=1
MTETGSSSVTMSNVNPEIQGFPLGRVFLQTDGINRALRFTHAAAHTLFIIDGSPVTIHAECSKLAIVGTQTAAVTVLVYLADIA